MFKISQFFDENPWRNKSLKLNIFGPLLPKTHSAMFRMAMVTEEAGGESEKFSSCVEDGLLVSQVLITKY